MQNETTVDRQKLEELVDLLVDGELSEEAAREAEKAIQADETASAEYAAAIGIREGLAKLRAELPEGFAERLQKAIAESAPQFAPTARRAAPAGVWRALKNPRAVAGLAASVAVAVGVVYQTATREKPSPVDVPEGPIVAENSVPPERVVPEDPDVMIRTPSPAGNLPESVGKRDEQSALWLSVSVAPERELKTAAFEFKRLCDAKGIEFVKNGDGEFLLKEVDPSEWREIAEKMNPADARSESRALKSWKEDSSEPREVRVLFEVAETASSKTPVEE
ncbi:MAG: hypothetical protein IJM30_03140 [Thermoguttaceae bacterium]|nr:hypothetical protein [Thermoguttaceae bacterium]